MTKFADQLFDDLMQEHGSTLAHTRPPAPSRHIAARRTLLATGGVAVAVAATAGGLLASGAGTPAYALTTHPDGTVTLDVYSESGFAGANAKLRQLDDGQVVVVPVGPGCPSINSLPAPAVPLSGPIAVQASGSRGGSVTVNAKGIPAGDILVVGIQTTTHGNLVTTGGASRLTSPPAPSCVSLPSLPAPPPGNGGSGSSSGSGSGTTVSGNS